MEARPTPSNEHVSRQMRSMPRRNTKPEVALRRELHRMGLRFVLGGHGLAGNPDVVFTRRRIAVFVDGCFWHRCPEHAVQPKSNSEWWAQKLAGNVDRDRRADQCLTDTGWTVVRVWEHEDPIEAACSIYRLWNEHDPRFVPGTQRSTYDPPASPPMLPGSRARELDSNQGSR